MRAFPLNQGEAYPLLESRGKTFEPAVWLRRARALGPRRWWSRCVGSIWNCWCASAFRVSLARRFSIYYYPMEKRVSLYTLIGAAIRPRGTNLDVGLTFDHSYMVRH